MKKGIIISVILLVSLLAGCNQEELAQKDKEITRLQLELKNLEFENKELKLENAKMSKKMQDLFKERSNDRKNR